LSYFAANSLFQAQHIPLGNPNSILVQDENLGKITFYNGDISSSQSGVRSAIKLKTLKRNGLVRFKRTLIKNEIQFF
jgi:hypothetical protein